MLLEERLLGVSHTWALVCEGSHIHTSSQEVCLMYTSGGVKSL